MSKASVEKKSVVVLGGGHAGVAVTRLLSSSLSPAKYSLTLINARPFFIHYPASIRLTVSSQHNLDGRTFMEYDQLFTKNGSFMLGTATSIEKHANGGEVVLKDGARVKFDVLVLAPGSRWEGPLSFPDTDLKSQQWIKESRARFSAAKEVVLVGGGAVGSEFAGEIKDAYPDTKVTIVHGDSQVLNKAYPDKFRRALEKSLRERGVEFVFNDYVDVIPETPVSQVTTRKGKVIKADLVVTTRGSRPNTAFLSSLGPKTLTSKGHVKIRPTLQLLAHSDIFALGDVLDVEEQKQAGKVHAHAKVVAANVLSVLEDKEPKSVYKGSIEMIVVTNGKKGGVSYFGVLWGLLFGAWFTSFVKSKGLLVSMARSSMGYSN